MAEFCILKQPPTLILQVFRVHDAYDKTSYDRFDVLVSLAFGRCGVTSFATMLGACVAKHSCMFWFCSCYMKHVRSTFSLVL